MLFESKSWCQFKVKSSSLKILNIPNIEHSVKEIQFFFQLDTQYFWPSLVIWFPCTIRHDTSINETHLYPSKIVTLQTESEWQPNHPKVICSKSMKHSVWVPLEIIVVAVIYLVADVVIVIDLDVDVDADVVCWCWCCCCCSWKLNVACLSGH